MNAIVKKSVDDVGMSTSGTMSTLAPENLGDVIRFSDAMARSDIAIPKHLRGNAGACMAVTMQALQWEMNPFAVASKSYSVRDMISYEAQLIAAVVNTRSGIKGRLKYTFEGEGDEMQCTVTGTLDGEECSYTSPPIGQIAVKNSPLWNSDPQQQLGYYSARSWARRHTPEVILGVYDRDEIEHRGPDNAKDVTPSSMAERYSQPDTPADHVTQELLGSPTEAAEESIQGETEIVDPDTGEVTEAPDEALSAEQNGKLLSYAKDIFGTLDSDKSDKEKQDLAIKVKDRWKNEFTEEMKDAAGQIWTSYLAVLTGKQDRITAEGFWKDTLE